MAMISAFILFLALMVSIGYINIVIRLFLKQTAEVTFFHAICLAALWACFYLSRQLVP